MKIESSNTLGVAYRLDVIRSGEVAESRAGKNLVVNGGLSEIGIRPINSDLFYTVRFGSGSAPVKRGSGAVTFTTTGSGTLTVTASAGFFIASDVGRILKLNTGEELTVTVYTSGTVATATTASGTVTQAAAGSIHYVNDTDLSANEASLGNPLLSAGVPAFNAGTGLATFTLAADSTAATSGLTVREMGWWSYGGVMVGRVLLASPVAMQVGDILRLTLVASVTLDLAAKPLATGVLPGTSRFYGGNFSGGGYSLSSVFSGQQLYVGSTALTLATIRTTTEITTEMGYYAGASSVSITSPSLGVFVNEFKCDVNTANGTIRSLGFNGLWAHALSGSFVKDNTSVLTIQWTVKITRTLTN